MKKETAFTLDQQAQITAAAVNFFNQITLEDFNKFLIMYAWQKAEQKEVPEETPFYFQSQISSFVETMVCVLTPSV